MTSMFRTLLHHRGFVLLSAFTLALAVGANLVVFTIVNAIWLRPPAVADANRVVMVLGQNDLQATSEGHFWAPRGLECFVRGQPVFQHVAGQVATSGENAEYEPHITIDRLGRDIETIAVTWHYFSVIGAPIRGRDFTDDDDRKGAPPVAIISDRLWREAFGADSSVIGSVLPAAPVPVRVIGVAHPGFHGVRLGERADMWVPASVVPQVAKPGMTNSNSQPLLALARLKDGVPLAEAQRVMDAGTNSCGIPRSSRAIRMAVIPIGELYGGPRSRTIVMRESGALLVVAVTAGLVLVGGCATLMALVLMHYERRRQEIAVRMALGCSPLRLTRTLASELAGIGLVGLAGALGISSWALTALPALSFTTGVDFSRLNLSADWRVFTIGIVGTLVTLVLASALPMRRSTRTNAALELVSSSSRSTPSSLRFRRAMLAVHTAATVVVLVAAGLFLRTVQVGFNRAAGFDLQHTLFVRAQVDSNTSSREEREPKAALRAVRAQELIDRISGVPGVRAIAVGDAPIGLDQGARATRSIPIESGAERREGRFYFASVGPQFLDALRVGVLMGRSLTEADAVLFDVRGSLRPVVVTASFAQAWWPGEWPIGKQFTSFDNPHEVVGVVADFAHGSVRLDQRAAVYMVRDLQSATQAFTLSLAVGTTGDAADVIRPIRQALMDVFPNAVGVDLATGHDVVERDLGRERVGASFFSGFGLLALCLGLAGIFGLVAYHAESRRRDLGVRMALGATPRALVGETIMIALVPVVAGATTGLAIAAVVASAVAASTFGISTLDPLTYLLAGTLLVGGAFIAALAAARRVTRLSPLDALRAQ